MTKMRTAATVLLILASALTAGAPAWAQGKSLTLSMLAGYKEDVLRANLPEFEKKTGIKVVVDAAPFGDLYKKQLLSLSTGGGRYDVLFMDEPWIPPLSEFLLPLTERMKTLDLADFIPTTLAAGAFQGTQYALPVDPNVQILVYRKDLFEQKGLKPPATWDDLLAAAKALHDPAREKYGIAVTASSDIQTALYLLLAQWSYGAELVDATGRGALNTPAGKQGRRGLPGALEVRAAQREELQLRRREQGDPARPGRDGHPVGLWRAADGGQDALQRRGQAGLRASAEGRAPDADARRVDDRDRQEQRQPGRRLAVRHMAVRQGVRPGRGEVSERDLGHPQPARVGAQGCGHAGAPALRRHAGRQPADHQGAAHGCGSTPTSRSTSG